MSTGEMAYLALVIGSMTAFALTLAWALYVKRPASPVRTTTAVPPQAVPTLI